MRSLTYCYGNRPSVLRGDQEKGIGREMRDLFNILEHHVNSNSAYENQDCRAHSSGAPGVSEGVNCWKIVTQLIRDKLNIQMVPDYSYSARRVRKKPITQAPDKRSIIIKLRRRDLKKDNASRPLTPILFVNKKV